MSIGDLLADTKHSIRMFWKSPGFTLAAVAALALGIGANTAIFSIVDAVLLKPVPYADADRLVVFQTTSPQGAFSAGSPAKFQHWREQGTVVEDVSAYRSNVVNFTLRRRARTAPCRTGVGGLFPPVRRTHLPGPGIHRRGGQPGWPARGRPQLRPLGAPLRGRPQGPGHDPLPERRLLHRRRHRRPQLRHERVRTAARAVDPLPARPPFDRPGSLLPGRRATQAGRLARAGAGAAEAVGAGLQEEVPQRAQQRRLVQRRADARRHHRRRADHPLGAARRRRSRPADRLRQRGQPAARPGGRKAARDCHPCRDRGRPRTHRPATAHREPAAVGGRRRAGPAARDARHPSPPGHQHRRAASRRRERIGRRHGLARGGVHPPRRAWDRAAVRPDSRPPGLSRRPDRHGQGKRRPLRHRFPAEQDALAPGRGGSRHGAGAAGRIGPAGPHRGRPPHRRSRVRRDQRADDADVDERPALPEVGGCRAGRPGRRGPHAGHPRRGGRQCHLLRAPRGRLRAPVRHRGTAAQRRTVPRRRRVDDRVGRLLRRVQDSRPTRAGLHLRRYRRFAPGRRDQRGDGESSSGPSPTRWPTV